MKLTNYLRSAGIIAFELITLKLPFVANNELDLKRSILNDTLPDFDIQSDLKQTIKMYFINCMLKFTTIFY